MDFAAVKGPQELAYKPGLAYMHKTALPAVGLACCNCYGFHPDSFGPEHIPDSHAHACGIQNKLWRLSDIESWVFYGPGHPVHYLVIWQALFSIHGHQIIMEAPFIRLILHINGT